MASYTTFHIDEQGIDAVYAESGPAGQHVAAIRSKIIFLAKRYVGKKTHRLEHSITARTTRNPEGIVLDVTAAARYALMHHDGTRPHLITPNHQRVLRFKQGGRVVYARKVMHPGTRPNPFMLRALREAVR